MLLFPTSPVNSCCTILKTIRGKSMKKILFLFLVMLMLMPSAALTAQATGCNLKIGVSLHPYYSWVKHIVGDTAQVTPLIPPGSDPHTYQPMPADLEHLQNLDVLVINGVGHDEFVKPMLKATEHENLKIIDTSKGLPLLPSFTQHYAFEGESNKVSYNSHTYIALTGAVQQIQAIARELGKLCPDQATTYKKNGRAYAGKLRNMLSAALTKIDTIDTNTLRIATVHDGYAYLFQELGIEVAAVVQPRHGIEPSARQLQDTIKRIKRARVNILFAELDYKKQYVDIIFQETGCRIYSLSHVSKGEYTEDFFEQAMQKNLDDIVLALTDAAAVKK
jgi:zinc transport system substrate-binding protein